MCRTLLAAIRLGLVCLGALLGLSHAEEPAAVQTQNATYLTDIQPLLATYCLDCHSTAEMAGELDLQRFATAAAVRRDGKTWQAVIEQLRAGEMPPKDALQPADAERRRLMAWTQGLLDDVARARAGDPGRVPLHRLSNAEYDNTLRDLTGIDLRPAAQFPTDGAAGEGFTNAAEALHLSPALLEKYLDASKAVAAHAVLLPEGFRFSPARTRRDWTDASVATLRAFYARFTADADGRLPLRPYLVATVQHRQALQAGTQTAEAVAAQHNLSANYLARLWTALADEKPSYPLDRLRGRWRIATESDGDIDALMAEVTAWQPLLWTFGNIGSYADHRPSRAMPRDLAAGEPPDDPAVAGATPESLAEYRALFPPFICFPQVVPTDEVVCLKTFHREDEPLLRLFLDAEQTQEIDRLWDEHRFISRQPLVENEILPQFIGFVTQDQPQAAVDYFESLRPEFQERATVFQQDFEAAAPRQLAQLQEFAARAYRRPLRDAERAELAALYAALRDTGATHEDAFRGLLARVLVSPAFLLHVEEPPPGTQAGPVTDWELASRLSYFLWASCPDAELNALAAAGTLHDPQTLAAQTQRMLGDPRTRALAVEFGTQWLGVRDFAAFDEKNEALFPTFDADLRAAMDEETVQFFLALFRNGGTVASLLDADHSFLNERLAAHYGIPEVTGPKFRRVDDVRRFGRGGLLTLAAVQSTQAGASRTSPTLRGNWVSETLLGERLPRPPANVPPLPDSESASDGLTMRQLVERHVSDANCNVCHQRIDPLGFAFEHYDAIGRRRGTDTNGLPIDASTLLRDGTGIDGLDGLRRYLLTEKRAAFTRVFCRRLLGYALRRSVTLSDQVLLDDLCANAAHATLTDLIITIVNSPQFRTIRGHAATDDE